IQVVVSGSISNGSGFYADYSHVLFRKTFHPLVTDTNHGVDLRVIVPHLLMDAAFFVTLVATDTSGNDIELGIGVDSLTYTSLQPRDENRDRGREIGINKQFY